MNAFVIESRSLESREACVAQLERQVPGLLRVSAVARPESSVESQTRSHLAVIEGARAASLPFVWIMEDDCVLTPAFHYDDWLATLARVDPSLPGRSPDGFAIVLGGATGWRLPYESGQPSDAHLVGVLRWSSCHCWVVFREAYDRILRVDPHASIDVAVSNLGLRTALRAPFVAVRAPVGVRTTEERVDHGHTSDDPETRLLRVLSGDVAEAVFQRSADVDEEPFEDDLVLFQRENRSVMTLNKAAACLWEALRWPHTRRSLANLLIEAGGSSSRSEAERLVASVMDGLITLQFVSRVGP